MSNVNISRMTTEIITYSPYFQHFNGQFLRKNNYNHENRSK